MIICKTCNAEIPPAFVHSIQQGVCPGCGSALFSESDKQLLDELTLAMEKMPNNPQGIAGWLLSNYRFTKIGDAVPTERFHTKSSSKPSEQEKTSFMQRTNAYKNISATNKKLQELAQTISETDLDKEMYGDGNSSIESSDDYEDEPAPPKIVRQSDLLKTDEVIVDPGASISPEELEAVKSMVSGEEAGGINPQAAKILHEQRLKRVRSQQNFESGIGIVKRNG